MRQFIIASVIVLGIFKAALAQTNYNVLTGLNSDGGAMFGPGIDRVAGMDNNGMPFQQGPGSSMTNGAGNSFMTPNLFGATGASQSVRPPSLTPHPYLHTATPTISGASHSVTKGGP